MISTRYPCAMLSVANPLPLADGRITIHLGHMQLEGVAFRLRAQELKGLFPR